MYSPTLAEYEVYKIVYSAGIGIYTLYKNKILRFAMTIQYYQGLIDYYPPKNLNIYST
jgi:hypothetical protein